MRHRQDVVAGADPRAATVDHLARIASCQQGLELGPQERRRLEAAVLAQVQAPGSIERSRDVAGNRIDGLVFSPKPICGAGIDQHAGCACAGVRHSVRIDQRREGSARRQATGWAHRARLSGHRKARAFPGLQTAIEHRHAFVADPAGHPPKPPRCHSAHVVDHELGVIVQADRFEQRAHRIA